MADSSFDIVSKIDHMEVDNAFNQASREIDTRFDFKNTDTTLEKSGEKINIEAGSEEKAKAALEVLRDKLVKRGISLKHLDATEPALSGSVEAVALSTLVLRLAESALSVGARGRFAAPPGSCFALLVTGKT